MNESRKMATVRVVDEVSPIKDADRIEVCTIGGWNVITKKGEYEKGDLCVYLEIDTFCPTDLEPFAFLVERGTKVMEHDGVEVTGHVLKTIRLRGVYSQGLVLRPEEFGITDASVGDCLDERIGVWEYERPVKVQGTPKYILNPYDPSVAPKTDAERVQNCTYIWDALKKVDAYATVKVDGTSMTMVFDPRYDKLRLFSHRREIDYTEPSIAMGSYKAAKRQGIVDFCMDHPGITVQYELTGPKIQRAITPYYCCHVFAVWDMASMHKYDCAELSEWPVIVKSHVKLLDMRASDYETVADILKAVDGLRGNVTKGKPDEGVVFHITGQGSATDEEWANIRHKLSPNMEFKVVSNKYLLKG